MKRILVAAAALAVCGSGAYLAGAQTGAPTATAASMSFFVTSRGPGNGADLGGLRGADAHCQMLAAAVGAGNQMWRAFLSTDPVAGQPATNARDRIASTRLPIVNSRGSVVANTIDEFLMSQNPTRKQLALTERGAIVNGAGDNPNMHDVLTGSDRRGMSFNDTADHTCSNYTSSRAAGTVDVGHIDVSGPQANQSPVSIHQSRGCSQQNLVSTGGAGLFYCFAVPAAPAN